jgi:regulator of RNase E activity RraA
MSSKTDALPRRFAKIYTAAITDVMDEMGLQRQTLPSALQPLTPGMRMAGYAFTARGRAHKGSPRERDATLRRFLAMIGAVPSDSVLVLASNDTAAAHFGELSMEWFRTRKVRGAVIDGATRDGLCPTTPPCPITGEAAQKPIFHPCRTECPKSLVAFLAAAAP